MVLSKPLEHDMKRLSSSLRSLGFRTSKADTSLLIHVTPTSCCYVLIYVDDLIIMDSSEKDVNSLVHSLNSQFALKDLGKLSYFFGVQVSYPTTGGLFLSQSKYIIDLLQRTKMLDAKPISTPMVSGPFQGEPFHDVHLYRSVVGALQYATLTHPEISYNVNKSCQFMHSPKHTYWQLVKRILRYLKGVLYHGLWFRKSDNMSLVGFADADWASDPDDRKSTSGLCVYFLNNLISWCSKKQSIISRSSTEVEYRCLALLATELVGFVLS
ncbi:hypothetical protein IC582_023603 [Cucumis melo]|uniref:Uncharacterized mitochondrial protein AtMg00810-like n=1 Tax=Cucumis melo TaxID=3656 RepID=A0ABM3LA25_CUCME|nr:uncharacterized mitochondrial protein AtMg00810-like [Cucumis melo]